MVSPAGLGAQSIYACPNALWLKNTAASSLLADGALKDEHIGSKGCLSQHIHRDCRVLAQALQCIPSGLHFHSADISGKKHA